jgi:TRAP-type uncharacterized transport system substrate-binding protein
MSPLRLASRLLGAWLVMSISQTTFGAGEVQLLAGPRTGTQFQMAGELAKRLGNAELTIDAVSTAGPGEALQRMRDAARNGDGPSLAILQADVAQLYLLTAQGGNREAAAWLAPLRVLAPLHSEELHFLVRSDSPFESVQDIRDARINVGPPAGGTAMSVATLYRLLFDAQPAPEKLSRLGHEEALAKLLTDRSIDVVALLADQPAPLLASMKPEARRFVRLLRFDREHPTAAIVSRVYGTTVLRKTSYPRLLDEDVPALAVRLYLAVHGDVRGEYARQLHQIAGGYCRELPRLKAAGQPKWREVAPGLPALVPGWHYADTGTAELARCLGLASNEIPDACLPLEQALGLCRASVTVAPVSAAAPR